MVEFICSILENFIIFIFFVLDNIVNIIISISAALTASFAWSGLSIWKKQFKAKVEYNLAHKILTSVYKYRDAIRFIRQTGVIYNYSSENEINSYKKNARYYKGKCEYYENLYLSINDLKAKIYFYIFESEIHWNCELRLLVDKLAKVENDIRNTLTEFLNLPEPKPGTVLITSKSMIIRNKFFVNPRIEDGISKEISSLIKEIEDFLKPKLKLISDPTFGERALRWILVSKIWILACVGIIIFISFVYIIITKYCHWK